jgi:hypothetical protein
MKTLIRFAFGVALLFIGTVFPARAQIDNGLDFTTTFPFYVQNSKMPAGSYRVTQTDVDINSLLIQSTDGRYSAFLEFMPTRSAEAHRQTDVTFHKYGNVEYLDRLWVEGQRYGMKVDPTRAEKKAATTSGPVEHSIAGKKH